MMSETRHIITALKQIDLSNSSAIETIIDIEDDKKKQELTADTVNSDNTQAIETQVIPIKELVIKEQLAVTVANRIFRCEWQGMNYVLKRFRKLADQHDIDKFQFEVYEERKTAFKNEKNILNELRINYSPYIVTSFMCDDPFHIVLQEEPFTLFYVLIDDQYLPWSKKYKIMQGIAEGISFLHQHFILHLDIKAQNILLDYHDVPKICDFGLSLKLNPTIDINQQVIKTNRGTLGWVAPELLTEKEASTRSDTYSLGITFWQIATCEYPFEELDSKPSGDLDIYKITIKGQAFSYLEPDLESSPVKVKKLIQKCINFFPPDRPTAAECVELTKQFTEIPRAHSFD